MSDKRIDLNTTQNVVVNVDIASPFNRAIASILDLVFLVVGGIILVMALSSATPGLVDDQLTFALFMTPIFFYSFWTEWLFKGQTLGKMIMGLRVIKTNGENASASDLFVRWATRLPEVWPLGTVAIMFSVSSPMGQRLGDMLGDTIVVLRKSKQNYTLRDLTSIPRHENHEPAYPGVISFTDEDMILVKQILTRYRLERNKVNKMLVEKTSQRMKEVLQLDTIPKNREEFLSRLIKDYVVLTR